MKMFPIYSTNQILAEIDKQIDANRAELQRRIGRKIRSTAASWQKAWDAHPDLLEQDHCLFNARGHWQQERDAADYRAAIAANRRDAVKVRKSARNSLTKCDVCGQWS